MHNWIDCSGWRNFYAEPITLEGGIMLQSTEIPVAGIGSIWQVVLLDCARIDNVLLMVHGKGRVNLERYAREWHQKRLIAGRDWTLTLWEEFPNGE